VSTREYFDAFAVEDPGWYVEGSGWSFMGDAWLFLDAPLSYRLRSVTRPQVTASIVATGIDLAPNERFGVMIANILAQPALLSAACGFSVDQSGLARLTLTVVNGGPPSDTYGATTLTTVHPTTLTIDRHGGTVTCRATGATAVETITAPAPNSAQWVAGFAAEGTPLVEIRSFDVITEN
jgi:hypothetical protein